MEESLDQIREDYLENTIEELDKVEGLLLSIDKNQDSDDDLAEVFRIVHSLKGGSVSFEFPALTKILHQFEDDMSSLKSESSLSDFYERSVGFVDQLREYCETYKSDLSVSISLDETIKNDSDVLFIDQDESVYQAVQKNLVEKNFHPLFCDNFEKAKKYFVDTKYKMIIVSDKLRNEKGLSILKTLKNTGGINQETIVVQIESPENQEKISINQMTIKLYRDENLNEKFNKVIADLTKCHFRQRLFKSILYIEDDKMLQKFFVAMMKKKKHIKVEVASSSEEALKVLEDYRPDLILLDNILKGEVGEDVLKILSEKPIYKNIPVYFLTASPEIINLQKLRSVGNVKAVISKPFKFDKLVKSFKESA